MMGPLWAGARWSHTKNERVRSGAGPSQNLVGAGRGYMKYSKNIRVNESYIDMLLLKF